MSGKLLHTVLKPNLVPDNQVTLFLNIFSNFDGKRAEFHFFNFVSLIWGKIDVLELECYRILILYCAGSTK